MRVLVTGGNGFLGGAIVRRCIDRGWTVRSFSRSHSPNLDRLGVEQVGGRLDDAAAVSHAVQGCDLVFHAAAKAGVWGPYEEYWQTNVVGTQNVLDACRAHRLQRLVYTSSPSVVFDGKSHVGMTEAASYATSFLAHYPATKAEAERRVLEANGPDFATVSLRPHLIWGTGDNHLIPRLVARARMGKLMRVGDGTNLVDTIHVDNAADAHLNAADRLHPGRPIAGRAYFLSQDEPVKLWEFIDRILVLAGLPPLRRSVPAGAAYVMGAVLEMTHRLLRLSGEPRMTRFVALQLSTSHTFDLTAAKRDLGYAPRVTIDDGLKEMTPWLQSLVGARP